jgi:mono/diheme cytochrome c family protein
MKARAPLTSILVFAGMALPLTHCAGDGEGLESADLTPLVGGEKGPPTGNTGNTAQILRDQVQAETFSAICTDCHIGAGAPMGLQLSPDQMTGILNRASQERPEVLLVKPGDPDNSYLMHKIEGRPGIVGKRMPRDLPPLSDAQINRVRQWITALGSAPTVIQPSTPPVTQKGDSTPPTTLPVDSVPSTLPIPPTTRRDSLFAQLNATVFSAICTDCHIGASAPLGLQLTPDQTPRLLNRPSAGLPGMVLVKPGDPDNSYIVWKVEGHSGIAGAQMPRGLPPLPPSSIALMKDWIRSLPTNATPDSVKSADSGNVAPIDTLKPGTTAWLFREAKQQVFGPVCSQCHAGPEAPRDLELQGDLPLQAIGRLSDKVENVMLVKPGDPDNSYLVWKIEGRSQIDGKRMPRDLPALSQTQIDAVRAWIRSL